ncbi:hypothetical protein [Roseomonas sp. BN140053]|uniref:hypothetical protein n=1 Tax=Roseomonas sp. BN140053 TaxID=3391898 RepID=UPI0039E84414
MSSSNPSRRRGSRVAVQQAGPGAALLPWLTAALLLGGSLASGAFGQTAAPAQPSPLPPAPPERIAPATPDAVPGTTGTGTVPGGVLRPPAAVDPGIHAPTPAQPSTTPVIPPPGTPGGDPGVQPR